MKEKEILIFIGATNAGKTTFSKKLETIGFACFNFDKNYKENLNLNRRDSGILSYIFSIHNQIMTRVLNDKIDFVIYEGTHFLLKKIFLDLFNVLANQKASFVVFEIPFLLLWDRLTKRVELQKYKRYRLQMYLLLIVSWAVFQFNKSFIYKTLSKENVHIIRNQYDLDKLYKKITQNKQLKKGV
jgi:shikimate kinase